MEAVDLRDVHHLEVVLHDRVQRVMPLVVDLLLGEHHDRIMLVHPAVIHQALQQVDPVGKVHGVSRGTVVHDVVPRLVEEPEELLGDQQCLHGMVLGVEREDHAEVRLMHLPCEEVAEDVPGHRADGNEPVLPDELQDADPIDPVPVDDHQHGSDDQDDDSEDQQTLSGQGIPERPSCDLGLLLHRDIRKSLGRDLVGIRRHRGHPGPTSSTF